MSKIIQAVNTMILNSHKISRVTKDNGEIFFLYDDKHKWSITEREDNYTLYFYYGNFSFDYLITKIKNPDFSEYVSYSSKEIGTREALESLSELYHLLTEKLYGIDKVLDDIIKC